MFIWEKRLINSFKKPLVMYSVIKLKAPTNFSSVQWQWTYTFLGELSYPSLAREITHIGVLMQSKLGYKVNCNHWERHTLCIKKRPFYKS